MHFSNCYHLLSQAIILHAHNAWGAFTFHVHREPTCIVVNYHEIFFFHIAYHHRFNKCDIICIIIYRDSQQKSTIPISLLYLRNKLQT